MQSAIWNLGIVCLRSIYCYNCAVIGGMCSLSYWWNVQSAMLVVMVVMEGHGRPWKVMEGHRMSLKVFSYHQIDIFSEKS